MNIPWYLGYSNQIHKSLLPDYVQQWLPSAISASAADKVNEEILEHIGFGNIDLARILPSSTYVYKYNIGL